MKREDVAHAAGVLDVVGVFRVRPVGHTQLPMVAAHSTSSDLLNYLSKITGTGVTEVKRNYARFGCDEHCTEKHIHVNHSSLRWSVTGIRAGVLIYNVLPYLRWQREKAQEILDATSDAPYRKPTAKAMEKLGWKLPKGIET